jgi:hypothetical protein
MARYHMHKADQEITDRAELVALLRGGQYATLALCRQGEPYVVTLSYGYDEAEDALYFHTALEGLKLAFLAENPAVCGTVIDDRGYLQGRCDHAYRSVVFWGRMERVEERSEKERCLGCMIDQLEDEPGKMRQRLAQRGETYERAVVLRLHIDEMTGRQSS